ncbi:MAG: ABC transporter permease [Candidatus Cryptobacteroides sp.]
MWKYLLKKEFKQFFRDPGMPRMVMMFPFLIILVFPFAANMEVRNIRVAMVDNDRTESSALLLEKCASSGWFRIEDVCASDSEAQQLMDRGKVDAVLTVARGFADYLQDGADMSGGMPVRIRVNTVNGTRGSIGSQYLNACVSGFVASHMNIQSLPPSASSVPEIRETYRYNPFLDYKIYMIPALIVIALTMMCGFLPALNIVSEKEKGTIEQINVTPVRPTTFIICKMIPYVAVAYFMMFSCLLLAYLVFGYSCRGSYLSIVIFTFAHILVMASFGLLISNYSDNAQQAMFVIWFFSMVFMLMSGIFTPVESMPRWAQVLTYANPLRYFADAMRGIFLKGCTLVDVWEDLACLLGLGAATTAWAVLSYRKTK